MNKPDIYSSNKVYNRQQPDNELQVFNVFEKSLDSSSPSVNSESPVIKHETTNSFTVKPSPGFIINNDTGFVVNKQFVAKSSSPSHTSVLSNSLKNLDAMKSDKPQESTPRPKIVTPQKRVIDSPISLKTSTRQSIDYNSSLSNTSQQSNDLDDAEAASVVKPTSYQRKISSNKPQVASSPSSAPSVFRNLFNKFGTKMSGSEVNGNSDEQEDSANCKIPQTECRLIFDISPDEFKDCDHKLKLYFEVSLFTGGENESLKCLIKVCTFIWCVFKNF